MRKEVLFVLFTALSSSSVLEVGSYSICVYWMNKWVNNWMSLLCLKHCPQSPPSSFRSGLPNPRAEDRFWSAPVRNRAAQQEASSGRVSEASSAASQRSRYRLNYSPTTTHLWKNCLPRNQSLKPKRLGTAALSHRFWISHPSPHLI